MSVGIVGPASTALVLAQGYLLFTACHPPFCSSAAGTASPPVKVQPCAPATIRFGERQTDIPAHLRWHTARAVCQGALGPGQAVVDHLQILQVGGEAQQLQAVAGRPAGAVPRPLKATKEPAHQAKGSPVCRIRSVRDRAPRPRSLMLRHWQIEAEPMDARDEPVRSRRIRLLRRIL
jgi:hypothetical protein